MCECNSMKNTWEKVLEYASSPVLGTLSRKVRKGVVLHVNGASLGPDAQIYISDSFVRFTTSNSAGQTENAYFDFSKISSIRTISDDKN